MRIRLTISKIRGVGLIWFTGKYHALWLEWADGGQVLEDGSIDPLWIKPKIRYVHT